MPDHKKKERINPVLGSFSGLFISGFFTRQEYLKFAKFNWMQKRGGLHEQQLSSRAQLVLAQCLPVDPDVLQCCHDVAVLPLAFL